jgi:transposase
LVNISILGIDVDMRFFVVCLLLQGKSRSRKFKNCKSGFKELDEWLKKAGVSQILACMEATGRYGEALAEHLHFLGHKVVVANPAFISRHKESLNQHNKTDPTDAEAIADYARCFQGRLRDWEPMDPNRKRLRDVLGQIYLLRKTMTAFSNRGGCGLVDESVKNSIEQTIAHMNHQLEAMEVLRDELFDQLPALQEVREIVDQVPGIGPEISDALAAKIDFQNFPSGRELACFLGCASSEWKSGKQRKRGKQKKTGDKQLRSLLRQGASSAMRTKFYHAFVDRLRKKGLTNKQIVGALARKMLLIAHALVRTKRPFDRLYEHPLALKKAG